MKKYILIALSVLMLAGCSEDRSRILKVYNWADYIDESLIDEFEVWYKEQTGEDVEVVYQTFGWKVSFCPLWAPVYTFRSACPKGL